MNDIEQQQIEAIKEWWHRYGNLAVMVVAIMALIVFSWQFWQKHQVSTSAEASVLYEQMQVAQTNKKPGEMEFIADRIMSDYSSTPYAPLAGLLRAQDAVQNNDLALAAKQLQWVIDHAKNKTIMQIGRIRIARVLIAEKQPEQALKTLQTVDDNAYLPLINTLKGDALKALNKPTEAHLAYQDALKGLPKTNPLYQWIATKSENN